MPTLTRITIYPIKSLDGHEVQDIVVLPSGTLQNDRRYALVDPLGKYVNAKKCAAIHSIRATYSDTVGRVTLSSANDNCSFDLQTEAEQIAEWCSGVLHKKCRLTEESTQGYPDDVEALGPTIISTSSLKQVANWFEGLDLDETRRRFRMNLEFDAEPAFWEDRFVPTDRNRVVRFQVGNVTFQGRGVCQRCPVPTRNSLTGESMPRFAKNFAANREASLPDWAPKSRFDHFFRLGINTVLESSTGEATLRVGDSVSMVE